MVCPSEQDKKKKKEQNIEAPTALSLSSSPIDSKSGGVFAFCIQQAIKRRERQRERCGCFLWLMFLDLSLYWKFEKHKEHNNTLHTCIFLHSFEQCQEG